jgi:hypothetical protein
MKTNASNPDMNLAWQALAAAGIKATEVDNCADPACHWCHNQPVQLAA